MATLEEARLIRQQYEKRFRKNTPTRTAYLGDGKGYAASNIIVADNPSLFYAREKMTDKQYFVVPNYNAGVNPQFNLPVILGYDQINPNIEQILGIDMSIFPYQSAASVLGGLGPHHRQHEFGGGDEVFIDPELIKVGLFQPDSPPTFGGYVQPFYYSHPNLGLKVFSGSRIDGIDLFKPTESTNFRFVSISFNPHSGSLIYRPGNELAPTVLGGSTTLADLLAAGGSILIPGGEAAFPPVPGGEIPLATFLLTSAASSINWSSTDYYHSRLFLGKIDTDVYARLDSLERNLNISTLPTVFAGKWSSSVNKNIHDGDFRIGRINDRQTSGSSSSWGNKLYFSGALGTETWNSENSDPLWIARYNHANNRSYLRMSLGDDVGVDGPWNDGFQIGYTTLANVYEPQFTFETSGYFGIGTSVPTNAVDVNFDSIRIRNGKTPAGASAPGVQGQICWDSDNIYVCVSASTWLKSTLASW